MKSFAFILPLIVPVSETESVSIELVEHGFRVRLL